MDVHSPCDIHDPSEVEFNFVNRVIVNPKSGSFDSPSVVMIPTIFNGFTRRRGFWAVKSVGAISSESLSITVTGTPEFVSRIFA